VRFATRPPHPFSLPSAKPGKMGSARAWIGGPFVDLLQRHQLRRRQARVGLRTVACECRGNERAALRIGDDAVAETVESVALRQHGRRDRGKLRRLNGRSRGRKRLRVPDEARIGMRLEVPGRADHDTVVILGEALGLHQTLAASVGARAEVRMRRRPAVVRLDETLGGDGDQVLCAIQVVHDPFGMAYRPPLIRSEVARVGRGRRIPAPQELVEAAVEPEARVVERARIAAFAGGEELPVPGVGGSQTSK